MKSLDESLNAELLSAFDSYLWFCFSNLKLQQEESYHTNKTSSKLDVYYPKVDSFLITASPEVLYSTVPQ